MNETGTCKFCGKNYQYDFGYESSKYCYRCLTNAFFTAEVEIDDLKGKLEVLEQGYDKLKSEYDNFRFATITMNQK